MTGKRPSAKQLDERLTIPLDAEDVIEGVLHAGPHVDGGWYVSDGADDPRFLADDGTWDTVAAAISYDGEAEAVAAAAAVGGVVTYLAHG